MKSGKRKKSAWATDTFCENREVIGLPPPSRWYCYRLKFDGMRFLIVGKSNPDQITINRMMFVTSVRLCIKQSRALDKLLQLQLRYYEQQLFYHCSFTHSMTQNNNVPQPNTSILDSDFKNSPLADIFMLMSTFFLVFNLMSMTF